MQLSIPRGQRPQYIVHVQVANMQGNPYVIGKLRIYTYLSNKYHLTTKANSTEQEMNAKQELEALEYLSKNTQQI